MLSIMTFNSDRIDATKRDAADGCYFRRVTGREVFEPLPSD